MLLTYSFSFYPYRRHRHRYNPLLSHRLACRGRVRRSSCWNLLEQAAEQQRQSREGRTTGSVQQVEQIVEVVTGPCQMPEHPKAQQTQTAAESSMKAYLELRDKIKGDEEQIMTMQQSVTFQSNALRELEQNPCSDDVEQEEKRKACERVLAQLERPLQQLMVTQQTDRIRLQELKCTAEKACQQFRHVRRNFQTPSKPSYALVLPGILLAIRQNRTLFLYRRG